MSPHKCYSRTPSIPIKNWLIIGDGRFDRRWDAWLLQKKPRLGPKEIGEVSEVLVCWFCLLFHGTVCVCSVVCFELTGQPTALLSGLRSRLVVLVDAWALGSNPRWLNRSPAAACYHAVEVLGLSPRKVGGDPLPLPPRHISSEPKGTRLVQAGPNIRFKMYPQKTEKLSASRSSWRNWVGKVSFLLRQIWLLTLRGWELIDISQKTIV